MQQKSIEELSQQQESQSFQNFIDCIKSAYTKRNYINIMGKFLKFSGHDNFDSLISLPRLEIEKFIQSYIVDMKKGLTHDYIAVCLSAISTFFMINDIDINRKKLNKFQPEKMKAVKDRGYTHEEVRKMIQNADLRMQVVIYILASTGIRIGALLPLSLRHLQKIDKYNIYKFTI